MPTIESRSAALALEMRAAGMTDEAIATVFAKQGLLTPNMADAPTLVLAARCGFKLSTGPASASMRESMRRVLGSRVKPAA